MPNVGYASLQVIPSVQGIGAQLREQLTGPVEDAGDEASKGFASRLLKGLAVGVAGAGAAVGALVVKGLTDSIEQGQIVGELRAQLGSTGPQAAQYGKVAGQLFAGTMADSFEQGTEAIKAVISSGLVPPGATNAQLKEIGGNVLDLSKAFKVDLGETSTAVGQLIRTGMAKDAKAGLDLVAAGLRGTDERGGDVLETFTEYSPVFKTMGLDGQTALGLIRQGLAGGAKETDKIGDAIKEFSLRVTGGGASIDAAFKSAGLSSTKLTADVAAGGPRATAALGTVLDALRQMPATAERAQAIQNLFGGPGEDLGAAIFSLNVKTAAGSLGTLAGAADATGSALRDNAGAKIEAFKRTLEQGLTTTVGNTVLPALTSAATFVGTVFGPAFGRAATWIRSEVVPAAAELAGRVRDDLVPVLTSGTTWLADHLVPAAVAAGHWLQDDLAPAVLAVARVLRDDVIPAIVSTVGWLDHNKTSVLVVAGVITAALLPVLITTAVGYAQTGIAAVTSSAQQIGAWVSTKVAAVTSAAQQVAASYTTVGGWISAGASAVVSAAQQVGAWVATGARALWGMALQAAASATVVGGWVLMGVQSLIQAARMAAAWVLAMGPVGWIITAVVALAALIIANWDTIRNATVAAFTAVVDWIKGAASAVLGWLQANWPLLLAILTGPIGIAVLLIVRYWDQITAGFQAAYNGVVSVGAAIVSWVTGLPGRIVAGLASLGTWLYNAAVSGFTRFLTAQAMITTQAIDYVRGLPGRIVSAIGNLGSLLYSAGGDVVRGMWNGISAMGGWLRDKLIGFAKAIIPGPIAKALGINSPSKVMASEVGRWIPAGIVAGIEQGTPELQAAMASLVPVDRPPAWMLPATAAAVPAASRAAALVAPSAAAGGGITVPVTYNAPMPEDPQKAAMEIGRRVGAAVAI